MFQRYCLNLSHLLLPLLCPESVRYVSVSIPALRIGSSVPFFLIPFVCVNIQYGFSLSDFLHCITGSRFIHLTGTDSNVFLVFLQLVSWRLWCYSLATVTGRGDGASEFLGAPTSVTVSPKPCFDSGRATSASGATFRQSPSGTRFSFKKLFSSEYEFTVNLSLIDSHKTLHFVCVITEMESRKCHRLNCYEPITPENRANPHAVWIFLMFLSLNCHQCFPYIFQRYLLTKTCVHLIYGQIAELVMVQLVLLLLGAQQSHPGGFSAFCSQKPSKRVKMFIFGWRKIWKVLGLCLVWC